jgi:hypothetical protein
MSRVADAASRPATKRGTLRFGDADTIEVRAGVSKLALAAALPVSVFCISWAVYVSLRSLDYTAVDGALRCLEVYRHPTVQFHPINHLLYPVNVFLWTGWLRAMGDIPRTPFEFIAQCQAMNAAGAALTLALVFRLVQLATGKWHAALAAVLLLGSTRAFLVHATSSAEPMVAVAFGTAGVWLVAESVRTGRIRAAALAGVMSAWAVASYLTAAILAVLALSVLMRIADSGRRVRQVVTYLGSVALTLLVIAAAVQTLGSAIANRGAGSLVTLPDNAVYGGFSVSRAANVLPGFAQSLVDVLPSSYEGVRWLITADGGPRTLFALCCVLLGVLLVCSLLVTREGWHRLRRAPSVGVIAASLALSFVPLLYRDPLYDKLWLIPLALLSWLTAKTWAGSTWARRLPLACAIAAMMVVNTGAAVRASRTPTPLLNAAREVSDAVRPSALVVAGFDGVSSLFASIFGDGVEVLVLPASLNRAWRSAIARAAVATRAGGAPLYFLGVLDLSRKQWDDFLGSRVGIPYSELAQYRRESVIVQSFTLENGIVSLRRWDSTANGLPDARR